MPDCIILRPTAHRRQISVENAARHGIASPREPPRPPATSSIHRQLSGGRGFFAAGGRPAGHLAAARAPPQPPAERSSPPGAISYRRHGNRAGQPDSAQHLRVTEIRCPDVQSDHARPRRAVRGQAPGHQPGQTWYHAVRNSPRCLFSALTFVMGLRYVGSTNR